MKREISQIISGIILGIFLIGGAIVPCYMYFGMDYLFSSESYTLPMLLLGATSILISFINIGFLILGVRGSKRVGLANALLMFAFIGIYGNMILGLVREQNVWEMFLDITDYYYIGFIVAGVCLLASGFLYVTALFGNRE